MTKAPLDVIFDAAFHTSKDLLVSALGSVEKHLYDNVAELEKQWPQLVFEQPELLAALIEEQARLSSLDEKTARTVVRQYLGNAVAALADVLHLDLNPHNVNFPVLQLVRNQGALLIALVKAQGQLYSEKIVALELAALESAPSARQCCIPVEKWLEGAGNER